MTHVPFSLPARRFISRIVQRGNSVRVISPQTVDERPDWLQRSFVESEIPGEDVHCCACLTDVQEEEELLTESNRLHLRPKKNVMLKLNDLTLVLVDDFQRRINDYETISLVMFDYREATHRDQVKREPREKGRPWIGATYDASASAHEQV